MNELVDFFVSWRDLWRDWTNGPVGNTRELWGKPLWWWIRFGTIAQFIAILAIAYEIIGYQRLQSIADQKLKPRLEGLRVVTDFVKSMSDIDEPSLVFRIGIRTVYVAIIAVVFLLYVAVLMVLPELLMETASAILETVTSVFSGTMHEASTLGIVGSILLLFILMFGFVLFGKLFIQVTIFFLYLGFYLILYCLCVTLRNSKLKAILNVSVAVTTLVNGHFLLLGN